MSQKKPESLREQAEQRLQEEALSVAKSIQVPGQTKEQTQIIAKGIEKGIALYKQQHKAKVRERDKARKKGGNQQPTDPAQTGYLDPSQEPEIEPTPARPALLIAGAIFTLVAFIHLLRYFLGWRFLFENFEIPVSWSLAGGFLAAGLAFWMFLAARDL